MQALELRQPVKYLLGDAIGQRLIDLRAGDEAGRHADGLDGLIHPLVKIRRDQGGLVIGVALQQLVHGLAGYRNKPDRTEAGRFIDGAAGMAHHIGVGVDLLVAQGLGSLAARQM